MKTALKSARDYLGRKLGLVAPAFLAHVAPDPKRTGWPPPPAASSQDPQGKRDGTPPWHPEGPVEKWRQNWKSK